MKRGFVAAVVVLYPICQLQGLVQIKRIRKHRFNKMKASSHPIAIKLNFYFPVEQETNRSQKFSKDNYGALIMEAKSLEIYIFIGLGFVQPYEWWILFVCLYPAQFY